MDILAIRIGEKYGPGYEEYLEEKLPNHNFIWMTLGQLKRLNKFNNYLNVEARSLMTCVAASCYE